jgi:putative addiction module component (TIGR02574 family)
MTAAVKKTYEQLKANLAPDERVELAEMLLVDVDSGGFATPEIEEAWAKEIERRIDDYESGKVKPIPSEQVHAEIRQALKEAREARRVSARRKD